MKMYVLGWQGKLDDSGEPMGPPDNIEVAFSPRPEWSLPYRERAEINLSELRALGVRVGPHYCDYSIEDLPDGSFAIVCVDHPSPAGM